MCSGQLSLLPSVGWEMSSSLRAVGWLIGAVVCLLAANRGSNCSLMRAMDGRIVPCSIISSCQSAAIIIFICCCCCCCCCCYGVLLMCCSSVQCLQFISKTHMFFSCSQDGTIKQWDADSFQLITTLKVR